MMTKIRAWLKSLGAGKLVYEMIHRPLQPIWYLREQGVFRTLAAKRGEREMAKRAETLILSHVPVQDAQEVAFLTGNGFWYQSLFCAYSFAIHSKRYPTFCFYTDGTLQQWQKELLIRNLPGSKVVDEETVQERLANHLPRGRYPSLYQARERLVLMRKFLDVCAGRPSSVIFLDSDMLFWNDPHLMWDLIDANRAFFMSDPYSNYFYDNPKDQLAFFGVSIVDCFNSGAIGVPHGALDYDKGEYYCRLMLECPSKRFYFAEQTLFALLLGNKQAVRLPKTDYRLVYNRQLVAAARIEAVAPTLLHYAWNGNPDFKGCEWKRLLKTLETKAIIG